MTELRITVDTNVLVRVLVNDEPHQSALAQTLLERADHIAVPVVVFCELAWVLGRGYRYGAAAIAQAIAGLLEVGNLSTDRPAIEAGLSMLRQGGDFADGVIAFQGKAIGGGIFASFDQKAATRIKASGGMAADPAELVPAPS